MSPPAADAVRLLGLEMTRARRARRWTQEELAERAGISVDTLRAAEHGSGKVAVGTMFELATLLGLDVLSGVARASLVGPGGATGPIGPTGAIGPTDSTTLLRWALDRLDATPSRVRPRSDDADSDDF
jgi:transcriptional regulator with XRE-family HTH domain